MCWGSDAVLFRICVAQRLFLRVAPAMRFPVRCVKFQENDLGCTDPDYLEFERNAEFDDGSCSSHWSCADAPTRRPIISTRRPTPTSVHASMGCSRPRAILNRPTPTTVSSPTPWSRSPVIAGSGKTSARGAFSNGDAIERVRGGQHRHSVPLATRRSRLGSHWTMTTPSGMPTTKRRCSIRATLAPPGGTCPVNADWDALAAAFGRIHDPQHQPGVNGHLW